MAEISSGVRTHTLHGQKFDKQKWHKYRNRQENPSHAQNFPQRKNRRSWRDQNRPFFRLDSTGENSGSSCEDLNGGISPDIQTSNHCQPKFPAQDNRCTRQGGGLLDKVKSAFGTTSQIWPPRRNTTRNLTQSQWTPSNINNNSDFHLASLDSVAEKLSNMSMPNTQHWGNPTTNWQQNGHGSPANRSAQGQWGRNSNVPYERNHNQIFHPYQGMNQSPFLSTTQNYQRNFFRQPWQQMMRGNYPCYPPFSHGFNNFAPPPWQQQQRSDPLFSWQQWRGPQMMQGCRNQAPMARHQRACSPAKKPKWNNQQRNRQRNLTPSKTRSRSHADHCNSASTQTPVQPSTQIKSHVQQPVHVSVQVPVSEVQSDEISKEEIICTADNSDSKKDVGDNESAIFSSEDLVKTNQDKEQLAFPDEHTRCQTSCPTPKTEQDDENFTIYDNEKCKPPTSSRPEDIHKERDTETEESDAILRHSSIELILADYEVKSSIQDKEMAQLSSSDPESDGDSDSAVETNADLWESFTASDDPYNPLCGWRCSNSIQHFHPAMKSPVQDCHVDSGTDEGDNWSETDSDDDYDSGDDSPIDDVDTSLPRSFKLSDPQLQELRDNLSSTPKEKPGSASAHHPSVAFILGTTSSSSDEDDDDDWDTLDDLSSSQDDPLWNSFNRARDPYSPIEAWKCHGSNLSSNISPNPSATTPVRKDSVEGLRTLLLASTEQKETLPQPCEKLSSRDSDGEIFAIASVRVHGAKDDIDLGSPIVGEVTMKRVASASCLRRFQMTPQDKATKKVRFCPDSSFIVLVEKDPASCEDNPRQAAENDWQACARDRMRFKARIDQLSHILDPVLTNTHREQVYASRLAMENR